MNIKTDFEIDEDLVRLAIAGDRGALGSAFSWCRTPQGHDYWQRQRNGRTPIDVAALKAMLGEPDRLALDGEAQCCICGKTGLSTKEGDGGTECQLHDGRWTCCEECYDVACALIGMLGQPNRMAVLERALGYAIEALAKDAARFKHAIDATHIEKTGNGIAMHREWLISCATETRATLARLKQIAEGNQ
jgi:hypothetical protein